MVNVTAPIITLAFVFDKSFHWAESIMNYTIQMLNNRTDSWYDDIFGDGTVVEGRFALADCDGTDAADAYWDIRERFGGVAPMGCVGARCSQSTMALGVVTTVENVPLVSPASNSPILSDKEQFPLVSRLVAPADARGEAGALVALCDELGWDRVSIILTDNQYSQNLATAFKGLWLESGSRKREIAYTNEVRVNTTGDADEVMEESVLQVLNEVPTDNPAVNSRVIILIAHEQHAYDILRIAHLEGFQEDTIWVGSGAWVGNDRTPEDHAFDTSTYRQGYLGVYPSPNRNKDYQDYLRVLNSYRVRSEEAPYTDLPDYAAETLVDSILALVMAFSELSVESRRNGSLVTSRLRNMTFGGVNGMISFTPEGDRANPTYSVLNAQADANGTLTWVPVGTIGMNGTSVGFSTFRISEACFAEAGCGLANAPGDSYWYFPIPVWVVVVIPLIAVLLAVVFFMYRKSSAGKKRYKQSYYQTITRVRDLDAGIEKAKKERETIIQGQFQKPDYWSDVPDQRTILVEVDPFDDEYWTIDSRLKEDMPTAFISKIFRVQNTSLWAYFCFHKGRFSMNGIDHNEIEVWHGTSQIDPRIIYSDPHDGFMMQLSRMGFWGRGLYFASKSSYSHSYAYKPYGEFWHTAGSDRPEGRQGEREMFLAKLLVGNATDLVQDSTLVTPPYIDPTQRGQRFNTVRGETGGSPVFIVYENGRAYPSYLVRYYNGDRDPDRTPYKTKDEAMLARSALANAPPESAASVIWEFQDNNGWTSYSSPHQQALESAYQSGIGSVIVETEVWKYEVDFTTSTQVNLDHAEHRRRNVRRQVQEVGSV